MDMADGADGVDEGRVGEEHGPVGYRKLAEVEICWLSDAPDG